MTLLEQQLYEALEAVIDSGLLSGLTELHDRTKFTVREAMAEYERQQSLEQNRINY